MFLQEIYAIEDCWYYSTTSYSPDGVSLNIALPSKFQLEYDIHPTDRQTSGGGNSSYVRIGETSSVGVWAGQLNTAGKHGFLNKNTSTNYHCPSLTVVGVDNHITIVYDGSTASYTCNNETVSTSVSNLSKINGIVATNKNKLKNIKVKAL